MPESLWQHRRGLGGQMDDQDNLRAEIVALTEDNWKRRSSPMLLSALGERMTEEARTALRTLGRSLNRYVRESMQGKVRYVSLPKHGGGVAPIGKSKGLSDENLEALLLKAGSEAKSVRRYSAIVWNAFRDGDLFDDVQYVVTSQDHGPEVRRTIDRANVPKGAPIIEPEDLPQRDFETNRPTFASLTAAIEQWAEKNNVDLELLTHRPLIAADAATDAGAVSRAGSVAASLEGGLWDVLALLSEEELRRITVPADIFFNIFKRLRAQK